MDNGTTHWPDCWRTGEVKHLFCALEALKDLISVLPGNLDDLFKAVRKHSVLGFSDKNGRKIVYINYDTKTVLFEDE